jgi:hypothetical protein
MCPLHSDDFLTGFPLRFLCSSLLCHPNICRVFSMTLSFAERFEWGSSSKECLLLRGSFRSKSFRIVLSGQQCLQDIREGDSVLRIVFWASSASKIFEAGLWSLELSFRASSASKIFEARFWSLELFLSGQQCLQDIRGGVADLRIIPFEPLAPPCCGSRRLNLRNASLGC